MVNWPWAGRMDMRHGMAALCVAMGGGLLTVVGLATSGCAGLGANQMLRAGYAAVLTTQDLNGDGALDRGEVAGMVERAFPPEQRSGKSWGTLRAWLIAGYMAQDTNGDGRLTLGELLKGGSAVCGDLDGDGMLSDVEAAASIGRCPAGMLPAPEGPDMVPANALGN
ncbi:hypothetical protein [Sphingomonas soli]|uniref:hypothetical protein n=1 Tax=Sphingomonas soli TaxID=266127 RepID=UPI000829E4B1|nr:hypothetical protein [Sphingomonas soli]